ncbi:MAG: lipoyl protein ligase domain-containing protein, partial [Planctomycetaceae bacterium]
MTSLPQPTATTDAPAALEVYLLGLVEFDAAQFLQERLVFEISGRSDRQGALLLCEHPPMITIGREGSRAHVQVDEHDLTARQIEVHWVGRGGGAVAHAPGQLAAYPVLPLDRLGLGLAEYRRRLEQGLLDVCGELHLSAR